MFAGIPDFRAEIRRSVRDGDTVRSEWRWTETRSDSEPFEVLGVTPFEIGEDRINAGRLCREDVERDAADIEQAVADLSGRRPRPTRSPEEA